MFGGFVTQDIICMRDRDIDYHAGSEETRTLEIAADTVLRIRVGIDIAGRSHDIRLQAGRSQFGGTAGDLLRFLDKQHLVAAGHGSSGIDRVGRQRGLFQFAVIQHEHIRKGQSAHLRQRHAGEGQTVLRLQVLHLRFAAFGLHLQQVRLRRQTFLHGFGHIIFQLQKQTQVLVRQLFLMGHRHHAPIGLIYVVDDIIVLGLRADRGDMLRSLGDAVHLNQTSADIDRLGHSGLCDHDMLQMEREGIVGFLVRTG